MANNRLYLVHEPSMVGAYIGKRMARGWYDGRNAGASLEELYEYVDSFHAETQDEYIVLKETDDKSNEMILVRNISLERKAEQ